MNFVIHILSNAISRVLYAVLVREFAFHVNGPELALIISIGGPVAVTLSVYALGTAIGSRYVRHDTQLNRYIIAISITFLLLSCLINTLDFNNKNIYLIFTSFTLSIVVLESYAGLLVLNRKSTKLFEYYVWMGLFWALFLLYLKYDLHTHIFALGPVGLVLYHWKILKFPIVLTSLARRKLINASISRLKFFAVNSPSAYFMAVLGLIFFFSEARQMDLPTLLIFLNFVGVSTFLGGNFYQYAGRSLLKSDTSFFLIDIYLATIITFTTTCLFFVDQWIGFFNIITSVPYLILAASLCGLSITSNQFFCSCYQLRESTTLILVSNLMLYAPILISMLFVNGVHSIHAIYIVCFCFLARLVLQKLIYIFFPLKAPSPA